MDWAIIISIFSVVIASLSLYFSFIRPSKIKLIVGNSFKVYYCDYKDNKFSLGIILPIDFINVSNKTGVILKTAISIYPKNQNEEHFIMQQNQFEKFDNQTKSWVFDEIAHSIVVSPQSSVNKAIWYLWSVDSIPILKLSKGEYEIKIYYWTKQNSKSQFIHISFFVSDEIESKLNEYAKQSSLSTCDIPINKNFERNMCMSSIQENKLLN